MKTLEKSSDFWLMNYGFKYKEVGIMIHYYTIEFIVYSKKEDLSAVASVTKGGINDHNFNGECTLFPSKDQRDWSKFVRFWDK